MPLARFRLVEVLGPLLQLPMLADLIRRQQRPFLFQLPPELAIHIQDARGLDAIGEEFPEQRNVHGASGTADAGFPSGARK